MTDLSSYAATELTEWLSQGTDFDTAPATIYVAVFDDTDTERGGDFSNGTRVGVTAGSGWTQNGTDFENASEVDFGEATTDVNNLQDVALYDSASLGNELARYQMDNALFDVSNGSRFFFAAGELNFDVQDNTE